MNEKKNLQDLCSNISEASNVSKKNSEAFLRSLFDLVEEALEKDGIAKIPYLGTFKLTTVEERKSVNVRTGEEIIIPSHKKVTFTPSKELKDKVNQPFAHLVSFYTLKHDGPVDPPEPAEEDVEVFEEELPSNPSDLTDDMEQKSDVAESTSENIGVENISVASDDTPNTPTVSNPTFSEESATFSNPEENTSGQIPETGSPKNEETSDFNNQEDNTTIKNLVEMENIKNDRNDFEEENSNDATDNSQQTDIENDTVNPADSSIEPDNANISNMEEAEPISDSEIGTEGITGNQEVEGNNEVEDVEETETADQSEATHERIEAESKEESSEEPKTEVNEEVKKSDPAKNSSKKWILWILLLLIVTLAALFAAKYIMDRNAEKKSAEGKTFTEEPAAAVTQDSLPSATTPEDLYFQEDTTTATSDNFYEEEKPEPIDCYSEPEKCTTDIAETEQQEIKNGHSFDPKLVEFMRQRHPELNFPATVSVQKTYTVKEGSRLAQVSRNIYDNEYIFWGYIYAFNSDQLKTPNDLKAGMELKVPDLGSDFIDPYSDKCKKIAAEVNAFIQGK